MLLSLLIASAGVAGPASARASAPFSGTFLSDPTNDVANAVAIQPDGKLVVAGTAGCIHGYCEYGALARYWADGSLDQSFGFAGRVPGESSGLSENRAVAIQPDGAIVVGGVVDATGAKGDARGGKFALARFLPSGQLDPSFGTGGIVRTDFCIEPAAGAVNAVAIQPDGRIVAAGFARCGSNEVLVVARFLSDGEPDSSFRGGWLALDQNRPRFGPEEFRGVALQRNGKIVLTGGAYGEFITYRLTPSGHRDSSFGGEGVLETFFTASPVGGGHHRRIREGANDVWVDSDNRILVAGGRDGPKNLGSLVRYLPSGKRDLSFGGDGLVQTSGFDPTGIVVGRCGQIVLSGGYSARRGDDAFAVATLRSDGSHAGADWLYVPSALGSESWGAAIAERDGRAMAVGRSVILGGYNLFTLVGLRPSTGC